MTLEVGSLLLHDDGEYSIVHSIGSGLVTRRRVRKEQNSFVAFGPPIVTPLSDLTWFIERGHAQVLRTLKRRLQ